MFPAAPSSQTPNLAIDTIGGNVAPPQLLIPEPSGYRPLREG